MLVRPALSRIVRCGHLQLVGETLASTRRQASRRSSPTHSLPALRVMRRPSPLSDDERVVALDPAVRGEDEEVEPDSEGLAVLGDLPVKLDDVAEPLGVVAPPEAEPSEPTQCSYALAARASISSVRGRPHHPSAWQRA